MSSGRNLNQLRRAAERGDTTAMNELGAAHRNGVGVPVDLAAAADWFRRAADANCPFGMINLSILLREGMGVPRDVDAHIALLRKACDLGHTGAMTRLAVCYAVGGVGVDMNLELAVYWNTRAADAGDAEAMNVLGGWYTKGLFVTRDVEKGVEFWKRAVKLRNLDAIVNLGAFYGNNGQHDEAIKLYKLAADMGDGAALANLGINARLGRGMPKNVQSAVDLFQRAMKKGAPEGAFELAQCHEFGTGMRINADEAFRLYSVAASAGFPLAMERVGRAHMEGFGTAKDNAQAFHWFERAATLREPNAPAVWYAASLTAVGRGTRRDLVKSAAFFARGAEIQHNMCTYRFANCLLSGIGVNRNPLQARALFERLSRVHDIKTVLDVLLTEIVHDAGHPTAIVTPPLRLFLKLCTGNAHARWLASLQFAARLQDAPAVADDVVDWDRIAALLVGQAKHQESDAELVNAAITALLDQPIVPLRLFTAFKAAVDARVNALPAKDFLHLAALALSLSEDASSFAMCPNEPRDALRAAVHAALYPHVAASYTMPPLLSSAAAQETALMYCGVMHHFAFMGAADDEPPANLQAVERAVEQRLQDASVCTRFCEARVFYMLENASKLIKQLATTGSQCAACHFAADALRCGGCGTVYYCHKDCQVAAWPSHKAACKAIQASRQ